MKIMVDLNVLLDVFLKREPFHMASSIVLEKVVQGRIYGIFASHAVTTLYYIVNKNSSKEIAEFCVNWAIEYFEIVCEDAVLFRAALDSHLLDFEDSVVDALATTHGCDCIITRNVKDFRGSVCAVASPVDFIELNGFV